MVKKGIYYTCPNGHLTENVLYLNVLPLTLTSAVNLQLST